MRKIIYFVAGIILFSSVISVMSWSFLTEAATQDRVDAKADAAAYELVRANIESRTTIQNSGTIVTYQTLEGDNTPVLTHLAENYNTASSLYNTGLTTFATTVYSEYTLTVGEYSYTFTTPDPNGVAAAAAAYAKAQAEAQAEAQARADANTQQLIYEPNFDFFMSKINQGYTEACLQEYIDEQMYRSCFLTDEWTIQKIDNFYIYMDTENFCVYRQFTEHGYTYFNSTFYDSRIHAELYDEPLCDEYKLLKWQHGQFDLTQIPYEGRNYFYLTCKDCILESNMLWNEKHN